MRIDDLAADLDTFGLRLRGGFRPSAGDGVPPLQDGRPAGTVLMVGNAGPAMWERFSEQRPAGRSLLDEWTRDVLTGVATRFGADAVYPFQRPFMPFQRWVLRSEACHVSPLQILIHPEYGLWHALRGALLFAEGISPPETAKLPSPCASCSGRPCLGACPVAAFSGAVYGVQGCLNHLADPAGEDCMALGCRARRACPVGAGYHYSPAQARFHTEAFCWTFR
jgi:hypothetical protein